MDLGKETNASKRAGAAATIGQPLGNHCRAVIESPESRRGAKYKDEVVRTIES